MKSASRLLSLFTLFFFGTVQVHATENDQNLDQLLEKLVVEQRASTNLVGLGAIMMLDGQIIGPSVSGERKKGSQVPLTIHDNWHIGSVTKSFTSAMIARLVEDGKLEWDSSIEEIFFDVDDLNSQWRSVTLEHLLTHTSGAISNFPLTVRIKKPAEGLDRMQARESAVINVLKNSPKSTPGTQFLYSNVGYTIAGVMAEKQTGMPWEKLIEQEIFKPLQIQSGGFGHPQDGETELEQPRGHRKLLGLTIAAGTEDDNTPVMGPAGTIHISLQDLMLFASEHLKGKQGRGSLLKTETFERLHTPSLDSYAYGWVVDSPKNIDAKTILWHNGSNTMWYMLVAIFPDVNAAIAVTTNDGNIKIAEQSAWEIIKQLLQSLPTSR